MFLSKTNSMLALCTLILGGGMLLGDHPAGHGPIAHPGDPVKQEEHAALFDLVNDKAATHVAVANGGWGDAKTWNKGTIPGAGARVVIPRDRTITIAGSYEKDRVDWLRVDGTLRFDPKVNTSLKVV